MSAHCSRCKVELPPGAVYCPRCGAQLLGSRCAESGKDCYRNWAIFIAACMLFALLLMLLSR